MGKATKETKVTKTKVTKAKVAPSKPAPADERGAVENEPEVLAAPGLPDGVGQAYLRPAFDRAMELAETAKRGAADLLLGGDFMAMRGLGVLARVTMQGERWPSVVAVPCESMAKLLKAADTASGVSLRLDGKAGVVVVEIGSTRGRIAGRVGENTEWLDSLAVAKKTAEVEPGWREAVSFCAKQARDDFSFALLDGIAYGWATNYAVRMPCSRAAAGTLHLPASAMLGIVKAMGDGEASMWVEKAGERHLLGLSIGQAVIAVAEVVGTPVPPRLVGVFEDFRARATTVLPKELEEPVSRFKGLVSSRGALSGGDVLEVAIDGREAVVSARSFSGEFRDTVFLESEYAKHSFAAYPDSLLLALAGEIVRICPAGEKAKAGLFAVGPDSREMCIVLATL